MAVEYYSGTASGQDIDNGIDTIKEIMESFADGDNGSVLTKHNGAYEFLPPGAVSGSGDMNKSVYDPDETVANAGGIAEYVAGYGIDKSAQASKTSAMTQPVGIDSDGKLWVPPGGGGSIPYVKCDTTASTNTKRITIDGFTLVTGAIIAVRFTNGSTSSTMYLNVNETGAKQVYGAPNPVSISAFIFFIYDGTYWRHHEWTDTYCAAVCDGSDSNRKAKSYIELSSNQYFLCSFKYGNTLKTAISLSVDPASSTTYSLRPLYINGNPSSSTNYSFSKGTYIMFFDGTNYYMNTDGTIPGVPTKTAFDTLSATVTEQSSQIASNVEDLRRLNGNQLLNPQSFNDISLWSYSNGSATLEEGILTFTASAQNGQIAQYPNYVGVPLTNGHKYYVAVHAKTTGGSGLSIVETVSWGGFAYAETTEWQRVDGIITSNATQSFNIYLLRDTKASGWDTVQIDGSVFADLTAKFGSGLEPTIAECRQIFKEFNTPYQPIANSKIGQLVGKTDYASADNAGVIFAYGSRGLNVSSAGALQGQVRTMAQYETDDDRLIVCKGTLTNILGTPKKTEVDASLIGVTKRSGTGIKAYKLHGWVFLYINISFNEPITAYDQNGFAQLPEGYRPPVLIYGNGYVAGGIGPTTINVFDTGIINSSADVEAANAIRLTLTYPEYNA